MFLGRVFQIVKVVQIGAATRIQNKETLPRTSKNGKLFPDGISTNSEKYSPMQYSRGLGGCFRVSVVWGLDGWLAIRILEGWTDNIPKAWMEDYQSGCQ